MKGVPRPAATRIVALGLVLAACGQPAGRNDAPPAPTGDRQAIGTVQTLAGPDFCESGQGVARRSESFRSLAVDEQDRVYADGGDRIDAVDHSDAILLRTGGRGSASRTNNIAPAGPEGLFVAFQKKVMLLAFDGLALETVASQSNTSATGLRTITSVASDSAHNLYFSETNGRDGTGFTVRFMNRSSEPVTFFKGTPAELSVAPKQTATIAGTRPSGGGTVIRNPGKRPIIAVAGGAVYVAGDSASGARVQVINTNGEPLAMHGVRIPAKGSAEVAQGKPGKGARHGPITFEMPPGMGADGKGNLYLANRARNQVLRLDPAGALHVLAGSLQGKAGFNGNGRPAAGALLNQPTDVKVGGGGRIYISDAGNRQLRLVNERGIIDQAPSTGPQWLCSPEKPAQPGAVGALAPDGEGGVYFINEGTGSLMHRGRDGAIKALSYRPESALLAASPRGGLYYKKGQTIRYINLSAKPVRVHGISVPPNAVRTIPGAVIAGADAPTRGFESGSSPGAMASDRKGNLFLVDTASQVQQIDANGKVSTLISRREYRDPAACCSNPTALLTDGAGNLYVGDAGGYNRVWFLNRGERPVTVHGQTIAPGAMGPVAGSASNSDDGLIRVIQEGAPALEVQFVKPWGLALDRRGNLYITTTDPYRNRNAVERVDRAGRFKSVAGKGRSGFTGFNGDGRIGDSTSLNAPTSILIDDCGDLVISDSGNDRIRRLKLEPGCRGLR